VNPVSCPLSVGKMVKMFKMLTRAQWGVTILNG